MKKYLLMGLIIVSLLFISACNNPFWPGRDGETGTAGNAGKTGESGCVHDWVVIKMIHPACFEDGEKIFDCTRCGETYKEVLPALGHDWVTGEIDCINGIEVQICSICGNPGEDIVVPALGHNWVITDVILPSCVMDGKTIFNCTRCGMSYSELFPAPGEHHYEIAPSTFPTCTEPGENKLLCTICKDSIPCDVFSPALGHDWDWPHYATGEGLRKCQRCQDAIAGVGDEGQGGGIIFYAERFDFYDGDVTTAVDRYYLEAAPEKISGNPAWQSDYQTNLVLIAGLSQNPSDQTDWAIGRGKKNTKIIINSGDSGNIHGTEAASACDALGDGWFLPSKNELDEIYKQKIYFSLGGIDSVWSSSQYNVAQAWGIQAWGLIGTKKEYYKHANYYRTCPVRAF